MIAVELNMMLKKSQISVNHMFDNDLWFYSWAGCDRLEWKTFIEILPQYLKDEHLLTVQSCTEFMFIHR